MKRLAVLAPLALAGCVTMSPQQMSAQSNWDVCRFTMGGPHSGVAEDERIRRRLDCTPYYPAIAAKLQAENDAINSLLAKPPRRPLPRSTYCRTVRNGDVYNTVCD